ncbi:MAG: TIGR00341 family protein [Thermoplasmata archaeon]|nr:MAG: TIGR00341 family protein [Thermoplasmata archaeon]
MRQINIVLPDREVKNVMKIAKKSELKAAHVRSAGEIDLVIVTVPDDMVNDFITKLKDAGIDKVGTVSILPIHAALSKTEPEKIPTIAPKEEIIDSAKRACHLTRGYVFMIVVSAFVATLGLMMNSPAIVIGAMVIAPLLGPSIAASVGTVMGDTALFRKGIMSTTLGLLIVIIAAAATAFFVNSLQLLPPLLDISFENLPSEIAERTTLNILIVGLALASGAAGAYSFAEKKGEILVGVMIAVALVPPASIVGIGFALLDADFIINSGLILAVNVFCINIAATLVFWKLGIKPGGFLEMKFSKKDIRRRLAVTLTILLILGTILGWTTYITYRNNQLKKNIREEAVSVLDNGNYLYINDVEVEEINLHINAFGFDTRDEVTVDIIVYTNNITECLNQSLASDIRSALDSRFKNEIDKEFVVVIIFQAMDVSSER